MSFKKMGMRLTIEYTGSMVGENSKTKRTKIIKKNLKFKENIDSDDIISIKTYYDSTGAMIENKCALTHRQYGLMIVDRSLDEISKLIDTGDRVIVKGFQITKKDEKRSNTRIKKTRIKSRRTHKTIKKSSSN